MLLTLIHLFGLHQESKLNRIASQETEYSIKLAVTGREDGPERAVLSVSILDQSWLRAILDSHVQEFTLSFCS